MPTVEEVIRIVIWNCERDHSWITKKESVSSSHKEGLLHKSSEGKKRDVGQNDSVGAPMDDEH